MMWKQRKIFIGIAVPIVLIGIGFYLYKIYYRSSPKSISWSDATILINQCQVKDLMYNYRNSAADIIMDLKSNQQIDVINPPPPGEVWQSIKNNSSTCGLIPFGGEVP